MFNYSKKIIVVVLSILIWSSFAVAADKLPEIMVGQTTVTTQSTIGSVNLTSGGRVEINNIPELGISPFTVMAWIKPTDKDSQYQTVVSMGRTAASSGPGAGWAIGLERLTGGEQYQIQVSVGTSSLGNIVRSTTISSQTLFDENWHHIMFTFDPSGNQSVAIGFDQIYKSPAVTNIAGNVASAARMNIGSTSLGYKGLIDEVRIYNGVAMDSNASVHCGTISFAEANDIHQSNLIGRWQFLEGAGGVGTSIADSGLGLPAGTLHNGTLRTGASWGGNISSTSSTYYGGFTGNEAVYNHNPSGKTTGKSLAPSAVFDGASSYIDAGTATNITGQGPFTVSVWVKRSPIGISNDEMIFSQARGWYGDLELFIDNTNANTALRDKIIFSVSGTSGELLTAPGRNNFYLRSNASIPRDNTWHHIAAVRKDDGFNAQIWIDGALDTDTNLGSITCTGQSGDPLTGIDCVVFLKKLVPVGSYGNACPAPDTYTGTDIFTNIGRSSYVDCYGHTPLYKYFKGNISSVRTYDKALNDAEIGQLRTETNVSLISNLKAYWKLNEGTGNSVADFSPTHNTATFYNPVWSEDGPLIADTNQDELFGFENSALTYCVTNALIGAIKPYDSCFKANGSSTGIKVVTSRTSVNDSTILETAVLMYPQNTVMGDVYGTLNNFAFWGRNLHQSSGAAAGSDASWTANNYPLNSNAQAKWNRAEFAKNAAKIKTLKGEAPLLDLSTTAVGGTWGLQTPTAGATTILLGNTAAEISKYPEGKIWRTGSSNDLTLNSSVVYSGVGTIIVDGDLTIENGSNITPDSTGSNRLGFIVSGSVTIEGNNKIQASIYCPNDISMSGGNVELTGSFVASTFSTMNATNTRFYYDYALDNSWPPGFRFLNMPHAGETKQ